MKHLIVSGLLATALSLSLPTCYAADQLTVDSISHATSVVAPALCEHPAPSSLNRPRAKIALALAGGGFKCMSDIGVLRVFEREHIPIDYIVGTSMGATIGGLYSAGVPLDEIQKLVLSGKLRKALVPNVIPRVAFMPVNALSNLWGRGYAHVFTGKTYEKFLAQSLPESVQNLEDTKIPFTAVATNLIDGSETRFTKGPLAKVIFASNCVAPIFRPVEIGDQLYIDGGMRANYPTAAARATGADLVVGVLNDTRIKQTEKKRYHHLKGLMTRVTDVFLASVDQSYIPAADLTIYPDVDDVPLVTKKNRLILKGIAAGEKAANQALPKIRQLIENPAALKQEKLVEQQSSPM